MSKKISFGCIALILLITSISTIAYIQTEEPRPDEQQKISNLSPDVEHQFLLWQIKDRKELRVGMLRTLSTLYLNYQNPNQVGGFRYSLLKKYAEYLDVKLKVTYANHIEELIGKINEGTIDLIAADTKGYLLEKEGFVMGLPYHYFAQQVVYRKGETKPYSLDDITGNLTIPQNSFQSYILQHVKRHFKDLKWDESELLNQEELLKLVEDDKIDYTIADNRTVAIMQRIYPSLTVAFDIIKPQPSSWYFLNDPNSKTLIENANQFIKIALENGTIKKLDQEYFSYTKRFDYVDIRAFIRAIETVLPKYQTYFEKSAKENDLDWKFLAAMAYQESHWNPKAISSTGVRGMMMLTQTTAKALNVTNRLDAEQSIRGGSRYLKQIIDRMPNSIPPQDRIWFALAGYNMGVGHLWDARTLTAQLGKNPDSWQDVRKVLPLLSEEEYYTNLRYGAARGYQAIHFVDSIQQYYISLIGYILEKEYRQKQIDLKIKSSKKQQY